MFTGLATKYRPKKFKQVVGQPDIPIIKAVTSDPESLPPLLIFCGPSGVGKTTTARIVSCALNCSAKVDGEPCGACDVCSSILSDSFPNVYELDSASNGTADQLRELVTKAHLSSSSIKLFILDEAQSISAQGWNVLLKVLEEPPPECMFILITSEPRKIPPKIRTRALRFNFKSVSPTKLKWYIDQVCRHGGFDLTSDDLDVITDLSDGSIRDALMMLDQCTSSKTTALEMFSDKNLSVEFFKSVVKNDYTLTLEIVNRWWGEVGDAKSIVSQMSEALEKVVLQKNKVDTNTPYKYQELSDSLSSDKLVDMLMSISDWFTQAYSKAQIVMLATKLYKIIHGEAFNMQTPQASTGKPKKVSSDVSVNDKLSRL